MTLHRAGLFRQLPRPRVARTLPFILLAAAITALSPGAETFAQSAETTSEEEVIRVETNLVTVPVFVTDGRGRRIAGLTKSAFGVRDEGASVEVAYFAAGTDRVALVFLLDASGSTRDTIARQRETALALLGRFGEKSRVAVLRFWDEAEVAVPFTTEQSKVREAFQSPALADRRTAIFDAALAAVRSYETLGSDRAERRIVILISDGLDTASRTRASTVVGEARERGVSFYVIHLPLFTPRDGRLAPRPTAKGFRDLAGLTGGQFFTVGDAKSSLDPRASYDLAPIFQSIAEDLQGQYVLGFHADERAAGGRRRIEVGLTSAAGAPKLRVRALREGYILRGR
ncbi:MAG: VWA domain-containing protein [Pyrinomonadaceae bacterium]